MTGKNYFFPARWLKLGFSDVFQRVSFKKKIKQRDYLIDGAVPVVDQGASLVGGYTDNTDAAINYENEVVVFGDHTRLVKYINFVFAPGAEGVVVLKPFARIMPKLSYFFVQSLIEFIPNNGYARHFQHLRKLTIPLPPRVEQKAIVAKIETLFSELDKGVEQLRAAAVQLKQYRQSVLKAAFEGKLTADWRAEQLAAGTLPSADELLDKIKTERQTRYQQQLSDWQKAVDQWQANGGKTSKQPKPRKPAKPKELPPLTEGEIGCRAEIPNGWAQVDITWLLSFANKPMTTGPFGTLLKKKDHISAGVPVLGIENIGEAYFVPGNKIFVSHEKANELMPFKVAAGDIIISRSGTVGEMCLVPDGLGLSFLSTNLIRISLNPFSMLPMLFVFMFQSGSDVKKQVKDFCKGSTRAFLNQTIIKSLRFPMPSTLEQHQILSEIESRFSVLDELEKSVETSLSQAEALRQSILKKAFEGRLLNETELEAVRNDPDYEPAEKLLERIRIQQEKTKAAKAVKSHKTRRIKRVSK